jgi:hypothetical protein
MARIFQSGVWSSKKWESKNSDRKNAKNQINVNSAKRRAFFIYENKVEQGY